MAADTMPTGTVDTVELERLGRELLVALGEDPNREGVRDTPARWARWWAEFIDHDPGVTDTTFEAVTTDQLVAVSGLTVWSLCEHHLLPFRVELTVAYLARDHVLGLSKFARIANRHAHRLQLQERLVTGIADELQHTVEANDVAVLGTGEHLCMTMRGVRTPARVTSSVLRGAFMHKPEARAELFAIANQ